jgi:hypothetical protein
MTMLRVFKGTMPSFNYIFGNGKPAIFVQGVYRTNVDWEIASLENEIKNGHPHIYIDPNETEIDSEMVDPMNVLRAKIIAEYVAAQAKATDPSNDGGTYTPQALKPGNSQDVADAAAGGSGLSVAARLVSLQAKQ